MFSYQQTLSHYSKGNVAIWASMAFQAGAINTGGFLACNRFVSHVTGFGTLVGADAAAGKWAHAGAMVSVPLFFILGVMLSALMIDRQVQRNKKPMYPLVMFLIFALTLAVTILGNLGHFGKFGDPILKNSYYLIAALCLACGLQNATVTTAFGAIIRTTHLTGITTDLGIGIIRVLTRSHKLQTRTNEIRANWMRIGLISSFTVGSMVSAYAYIYAQYWGFLIPSGIASILFLWSLKHKRRVSLLSRFF